MQKLKMVLVSGVLVAVAILSVAGLVFSDETQTAPTEGAAMSNASSAAAPAMKNASSTAPAPAPAPAE